MNCVRIAEKVAYDWTGYYNLFDWKPVRMEGTASGGYEAVTHLRRTKKVGGSFRPWKRAPPKLMHTMVRSAFGPGLRFKLKLIRHCRNVC